MLLKKIISIIFVTLLFASGLWGGDSASFVDLGFSTDGRTFMFGQYGVQSPTLKPWAELYVVDVASNDFVSGGRVSYTHDYPILAGQDGSGVLYRLIAGNSGLASRYGVSFPNQGQPLYISLDTNPPASGETIEFRDFLTDKFYRANLVSSTEGSGQNLKSSFQINLETHFSNGQVSRYTVGNPQIKRSLIASYNIKRVIIDPQGNSIIFVIEMKRQGEDGHDIRYMVEALRL
ncbi:MAG: DUF2259 domain-containing protein [Treponema sp.]|nr:DUF2259 domain-containing protein [Treponema sp.]